MGKWCKFTIGVDIDGHFQALDSGKNAKQNYEEPAQLEDTTDLDRNIKWNTYFFFKYTYY